MCVCVCVCVCGGGGFQGVLGGCQALFIYLFIYLFIIHYFFGLVCSDLNAGLLMSR